VSPLLLPYCVLPEASSTWLFKILEITSKKSFPIVNIRTRNVRINNEKIIKNDFILIFEIKPLKTERIFNSRINIIKK
jgi:hypothetical protein